jgi:hypothetical protein
LDEILTHQVNQFNYINSTGLDLQPPKTILVFFYEGNDLGNNLQLIRKNYKGNEATGELLHSTKFNEWLNLQLKSPVKKNDSEFEENFFFTKFLIKSVKNICLEKSKQRV